MPISEELVEWFKKVDELSKRDILAMDFSLEENTMYLVVLYRDINNDIGSEKLPINVWPLLGADV